MAGEPTPQEPELRLCKLLREELGWNAWVICRTKVDDDAAYH